MEITSKQVTNSWPSMWTQEVRHTASLTRSCTQLEPVACLIHCGIDSLSVLSAFTEKQNYV